MKFGRSDARTRSPRECCRRRGTIHEYFLAESAMNEGQGGGEFYTRTSIVRLMVDIVEPGIPYIIFPGTDPNN